MKGTPAQIKYANSIIMKIQNAETLADETGDTRTKEMLDAIVMCYSSDNVRARDVIDRFKTIMREPIDCVAVWVEHCMWKSQDDLIKMVYTYVKNKNGEVVHDKFD